jgi:methenyltetrahydromethanopterin cyclohydrolase
MCGYILIIANSARMLAQAAYTEGFKPLAIDLYSDIDTQLYTEASLQVASLSTPTLRPALDYLLSHYPVAHVVYGSGFEQHPDSLHYLSQRITLTGNTPETFMNAVDKPGFFGLLEQLAIPYPPSVFSKPSNLKGWLSKPMHGQGGVGIKQGQGDDRETDVYWQKFQPGTTYSALFLADGHTARVVGFNRQWAIVNGGDEFMFSGIINCTDLSNKQKMAVTGWLVDLVPRLGLKGLNSLDFIHDGNDMWGLEINPRPSASMQLYAGDVMASHINACAGFLPKTDLPTSVASVYQIIYAPHDIRIPEAINWPVGCVDLPPAGVICRTGQAICSMIAHHKTATNACGQLQYLQRSLFEQLQFI